MSDNEAQTVSHPEEGTAPVRCNMCGWTGDDGDLDAVSADSEDGEPSRPCPRCKTDHYLMDIDKDLATTLGDEMLDLLRRIGEAPVDVSGGVARIIDRHREEPGIAQGIGELSEVFEMTNPRSGEITC